MDVQICEWSGCGVIHETSRTMVRVFCTRQEAQEYCNTICIDSGEIYRVIPISIREASKMVRSPPDLCQACNHCKHQWILASTIDSIIDEPPYYVCSNCLIALINLSLSKRGFKTLLASGHTDSEFLLHSDFYNADGEALQPRGI